MTTRKAKIQAPPQASAHTTVGIDIGFGFTKVVTNDAAAIFPSVAGHAHDLKFNADEISAKYPGEQVEDGAGSWLVGNFALKQIPAKQLISLQGRTGNDDEFGMAFRRRMMFAALAKVCPGVNGDTVHIHLSTGLPVDHMADAPMMKQALIGKHRIQTNNADFVANVTDCIVMPQPMGTIYSQTIDSTGELNPLHMARRTAVVDIGRYTIDCTLDDEGEFIDPESDSVEAGVYTAEERIADVLESIYRDKMKWEQIDQVLRTGHLMAFGEPVDYSAQVAEALLPLRDAALTLMNRLWGTGMHIDVIYLGGGGADLVADLVKRTYPQTIVVQNPQTSNANGYLNYARWAQRAK